MVALLDTAHPQHVLALGADRLLTVLTGVVTALLVGLFFAPAKAEDLVVGRARSLSAACCATWPGACAAAPATGRTTSTQCCAKWPGSTRRLDPHGAGSLRSRRSARTIRAVLAAQVSALVWLKSSRRLPEPPMSAPNWPRPQSCSTPRPRPPR